MHRSISRTRAVILSRVAPISESLREITFACFRLLYFSSSVAQRSSNSCMWRLFCSRVSVSSLMCRIAFWWLCTKRRSFCSNWVSVAVSFSVILRQSIHGFTRIGTKHKIMCLATILSLSAVNCKYNSFFVKCEGFVDFFKLFSLFFGDIEPECCSLFVVWPLCHRRRCCLQLFRLLFFLNILYVF